MLESKACNFIKKETPTQMFSWEYCENFRAPANTCERLKKICERLFLYFRILRKFFFLKNEKMANRKLERVGNLGNLGKIIPSFLIWEFSILPYSQNRKLRFKNLGKKFPRFPRCPRFPSFRPFRFFESECIRLFKCLVCCKLL